MDNLICDVCHEREATHFEEIMDGILNEYVHANLCDLCHADPVIQKLLRYGDGNQTVIKTNDGADALKQGVLKYRNGQKPLAFVPSIPFRVGGYKIEDKVNPMSKKFNVVVSLPKGVTETNFADSVGVIREAKRKDGSLIKMKTGGIVYRFPLNVTKLSAMIKKHNLKKVDKYGQDTVWLSVFEKDAGDKSASPSGSDL